MESERASGSPPFRLPTGTQVGDWCVVGARGHGAYGVVYRAVRMGQEEAGPVALKLALYPWDPRFMREVALLSLVQHPGVPRLLGHGFWKHPAGTVHPYVVMEWIEGMSLYDWAARHNPTSRQILQILTSLARVLQATHAASAVHRDVKGANVLVRHSDGRAMLMDFGAGHYQGAARLTWQSPPPGTPAYSSPEAGLFWVCSVSSPNACYVARPADDVFALGVTAYRLVTGEYPPSPEPRRDMAGQWRMEEAHLRAPQVLNPRVDPQLGALILRMLSLSPEARGTAEELADALEAAAKRVGPELDQRLLEVAPPQPVAPPPKEPAGRRKHPARVMRRAGAVLWIPVPVLALLVLFLVPWARQATEVPTVSLSAKGQAGREVHAPDAGAAAIGDAVPEVPLAQAPDASQQQAIAQDDPPKPFPEQGRPDEKGKCPGRKQVPINGGCWVEQAAMSAEECAQNGYLRFKGRCYAPALDPGRKPVPTSSPMDTP